MRLIKIAFIAIVLVIILTLALANRQPVEVSLVPDQLAGFLPFASSMTLPLFAVGLLSVLFGLIIGIVMEYLREMGIRREVTRKEVQVEELKRQNDRLKQKAQEGENEILALVSK
ncbi:LapA family protein [Paracoccaceae bacterium GXU_MW_L88]